MRRSRYADVPGSRANAGLRWLAKAPPDLDKARVTFKDIVADGHRASDVIQSVRAMFGGGDQPLTPLDMNELARESIILMRGELDAAKIVVQLELHPDPPLVTAHRGQLQQVVLNLVTNAIDAMRAVTDRARVLRMECKPAEPDGVEVIVGNSGTGIEPGSVDRIFDAFFTTKLNGMGMGLAICRTIVASHGGSLSVSAGAPHGCVFRMVLPGAG